MPYLKTASSICPAPPHTPKGVVVRQEQCPHLPYLCRTLRCGRYGDPRTQTEHLEMN